MFKQILLAYALSTTVLCHAIQYRVQDLGLSIATSSTPVAINDRGDVAGICTLFLGFERAFLWTKEDGLTILDDIPIKFALTSMNNHGQILGSFAFEGGLFSPKTTTRPFIWSKDKGFQDLGPIDSKDTEGMYINDKGSVLLTTRSGNRYNSYIWQNGNLENTPFDSEAINQGPTKIKMKGIHIAYVENDKEDQNKSIFNIQNLETLETHTFYIDLPGNPEIFDLSGSGHVVGFFEHNSNYTGFLYDKNGKTKIFKEFIPLDINDKGISIGINLSESGEMISALLLPEENSSVDIHQLILFPEEQSLGYEKIKALCYINQSNVIIGKALRDGYEHAILLIPIEEIVDQEKPLIE